MQAMILTCAMQQEKRLELSIVRECLQEASEEVNQDGNEMRERPTSWFCSHLTGILHRKNRYETTQDPGFSKYFCTKSNGYHCL